MYYWVPVSDYDIEIGYATSQIHTSDSLDKAIKAAKRYWGSNPADYILISKVKDRQKIVMKSNAVGILYQEYYPGKATRYLYENVATGKKYFVDSDGKRKR